MPPPARSPKQTHKWEWENTLPWNDGAAIFFEKRADFYWLVGGISTSLRLQSFLWDKERRMRGRLVAEIDAAAEVDIDTTVHRFFEIWGWNMWAQQPVKNSACMESSHKEVLTFAVNPFQFRDRGENLGATRPLALVGNFAYFADVPSSPRPVYPRRHPIRTWPLALLQRLSPGQSNARASLRSISPSCGKTFRMIWTKYKGYPPPGPPRERHPRADIRWERRGAER
ncbi:hypothetical protein BDP27DRAFT_1367199 [Rhodocollybia butyracea]|uniref:Uncharacterized protein n=1 Tax=Rhodocollybia butyracea TaxID=206335 RepID=A0A9P5PIF7_9AGAR|nr:hypothetical protein BDP27DRAFT_1367199 [Rhodocollybia butyracea]